MSEPGGFGIAPFATLRTLFDTSVGCEVPGDIFRMRLFTRSATYTPPAASIASAHGKSNMASTDGPPSPENPLLAVPAIVLITPEGSTLRIRLLAASAIYKLP